MCHLASGGFVGSMAFNRFIKSPSPTSTKTKKPAEGGYAYREGGIFTQAWDAFLYQLRKQGSIVGEVGQTFVGDNTSRRQDKSGMERSSNTITATSDVSRPLLFNQETFLRVSPRCGVCADTCCSHHLSSTNPRPPTSLPHTSIPVHFAWAPHDQ